MKKSALLWKILRPIKTRKDYETALSFIEEKFRAKKGTPEANLVEVLSVLVEKYEEQEFPIGSPDPIDAIRFRMEQLGWTKRELVVVFGSKSRVSEVLGGKRRLSLSMIRRLHKDMQIPADVLIQG